MAGLKYPPLEMLPKINETAVNVSPYPKALSLDISSGTQILLSRGQSLSFYGVHPQFFVKFILYAKIRNTLPMNS